MSAAESENDLIVPCAWCGLIVTLGSALSVAAPISHGICARCHGREESAILEIRSRSRSSDAA